MANFLYARFTASGDACLLTPSTCDTSSARRTKHTYTHTRSAQRRVCGTCVVCMCQCWRSALNRTKLPSLSPISIQSSNQMACDGQMYPVRVFAVAMDVYYKGQNNQQTRPQHHHHQKMEKVNKQKLTNPSRCPMILFRRVPLLSIRMVECI
jgi:hypothetical protein